MSQVPASTWPNPPKTDLAATRTLIFWTHLRASKPSEPRKSPSYTNNTNLVPQKRFMWYQMAVTQGFVPQKRFRWNKKQLIKDIRKSALSVRPPPIRPSEKSLRNRNLPYPYTRPRTNSRFSLSNIQLLMRSSSYCFSISSLISIQAGERTLT